MGKLLNDEIRKNFDKYLLANIPALKRRNTNHPTYDISGSILRVWLSNVDFKVSITSKERIDSLTLKRADCLFCDLLLHVKGLIGRHF